MSLPNGDVESCSSVSRAREVRCEEFDRDPDGSHDPHSTGSFVEIGIGGPTRPRAREVRDDCCADADETAIAYQTGRYLSVDE